jgi:hypothetical protein
MLVDNLDWLAYDFSVCFAALLVLQFCSMAKVGGAPPIIPPTFASRFGAGLAVVGALAIASKPGAGPHHLYPLEPAMLIFLAPLALNLKGWADRRGHGTVLRASASVYLVGVLAFNFLPLAQNYYLILETPARSIAQDLREIAEHHPGARIVLGDGELVPGDWAARQAARGRLSEPLLLFAGNPYLYDPMALFDMQESGLDIPPATINRLQDGSIDLWLFPKGCEPFKLANFYDLKVDTFPPSFREKFLANYRYQETSQFYDIWQFRSAQK